MTDVEKRVANRLKRGISVLAEWVPPNDNPGLAITHRTLLFRSKNGDYVMTGWPNGEIGSFSSSFSNSAESAAEAFVGTVGSTRARRALTSQRRRKARR